MLHTESTADPRWQRRLGVYPNKSAAQMLLRRHLRNLLLMWKGTLALYYSLDQLWFSSWCMSYSSSEEKPR